MENNQEEDVMGKYSMSLNQCWASKTNTDGVDNIYNKDNVSYWPWMTTDVLKWPWLIGPHVKYTIMVESIAGFYGS